jgi:hypothetical protein
MDKLSVLTFLILIIAEFQIILCNNGFPFNCVDMKEYRETRSDAYIYHNIQFQWIYWGANKDPKTHWEVKNGKLKNNVTKKCMHAKMHKGTYYAAPIDCNAEGHLLWTTEYYSSGCYRVKNIGTGQKLQLSEAFRSYDVRLGEVGDIFRLEEC